MRMLAILLIAAPGLLADDFLTLSDTDAVDGKEIRLLLQEGIKGSTLKVVYRPNSETSVEQDAGPFLSDGSIVWTPEHPGIASLVVLNAQGEAIGSKDVAIRFSGIPAFGILVMLFAGLLLFGGAGWSLVLALRPMPESE
jgi:hypothetical protein